MLTLPHTSPPDAALGGVALFGGTTSKTSNDLLWWNIASSFNASVSLERICV